MSCTSRYKAARKHLADAQLVAFFREAAQDSSTHAPQLVTNGLDQGKTLAEWCAEMDQPSELDELFHLEMELKVVPLAPRQFRITFGFHGGEVGDGAEWTVTYAEDGSLLTCEAGVGWTH